jgi:dTDP-4-dehydrorhamnose 3,5-epimerase
MGKDKLPIISLKNQENLIDGVVLHQLKINLDPRGTLVEALKADWADVYDPEKLPFAMQYFSITRPNIARDEDLWHVHKFQTDRFVAISGDMVVAIFDPRSGSKTYGVLNLFPMGQTFGEDNQFLLLIPPDTYHGFLTIGAEEVVLENFPTKLYNLSDEGRIPHSEAQVKLKDGTPFSWNLIRQNFK